MMREWATVISWQQGVAVLQCETQSGCSACNHKKHCGTSLLNKLHTENAHQLTMHIAQPLTTGQRVEIGLSEANLLRSAVLVYLTPLMGLMIGAMLLNSLFNSDFWALSGALIGGIAGFIFARFFAKRLDKNSTYHPVLLQIALPLSTSQNTSHG